mmetsp:Transcript_29510/g.44859  ORF Transcript_29510/g.44859 Transcript_29510/m.44859 type:complete len:150 (+) Transcript_29510:837-1286(+)
MRDNDGYTPLHLAVKSAESLESTRSVRALLYRNANTEIKDNKGNRPVELVEEVKSPTLSDDLVAVLERRGGRCDCLMLKTPKKKISRSWKMPGYFLFFMVINYATLVLFLFPICSELTYIYAMASLGVLSMIFWVWTMCLDPGYIKKHP